MDDITNSMDTTLSELQEMVKNRDPGVLQSIVLQESDMTKQLKNNWPSSYLDSFPWGLSSFSQLDQPPIIAGPNQNL